MKILTLLTASAALAAMALPAAAACGHDVTAEAPSEPIVTAERQGDTAEPGRTTIVKPAEEAADTRG